MIATTSVRHKAVSGGRSPPEKFFFCFRPPKKKYQAHVSAPEIFEMRSSVLKFDCKLEMCKRYEAPPNRTTQSRQIKQIKQIKRVRISQIKYTTC